MVNTEFSVRRWVVLSVIVSLIGSVPLAAAAGGAFSISVADSTGDVPADGSIVVEEADGNVVKDMSFSDTGLHTVESLEDGEYNLTVSSYGYQTVEHTISVDNGDVFVDGSSTATSSIDVHLSDATEVTSTFSVQDLSDEKAIEDATVELVLDGEVVADGETNSNGTVDITDYQGTYDKLRISADGYQTITVSDYAFDGSGKTIQLQEGSNGLFGGDGSGGGSGGISTGLIVALIAIVAMAVAFVRFRP